MADFDGIELLASNGTSGAVVFLRRPSSVASIQVVAPGVEVALGAGSAAVVVCGLDETGAENVLGTAPEYANRALDLLTMRSPASYALEDIEDGSVAWWNDEFGSVVQVSSRAELTLSVGGSLVNQAPITPPDWHPSMRYFRMSQLTDDLFDAFRNLYLALESLLSEVVPQRTGPNGAPSEGDAAWLRRALVAVSSKVDLRIFTTHALNTPADDQIFDELYGRIRTSIFHAKTGRPVLLPQDQDGRRLVAEAHERYTRLFLELARVVVGTQYTSGGFYAAGFRLIHEPMWSDLQLHARADVGTEDEAQVIAAIANPDATFPMPTARAPQLDQPFSLAISAEVPVAELLGRLPSVGSVIAVNSENDPACGFSLNGSLNPDGFDRLQAIMTLRGVNTGLPRSKYAT